MNELASNGTHTFRWSWRKIRSISISSGKGVFLAIALSVAVGEMVEGPAKWTSPFNILLIALAASLAGSILAAILVGAILAIGRAFTKTIVSTGGLLVQQALWQTSFIQWEAIESVAFRNSTGWNYLFLKPFGSGPEIGLSLEIEDWSSFLSAVDTFSPEDNPVRSALQLRNVQETA